MSKHPFETDRLILRNYISEDEESFVALNCDPVVRRHMNNAFTPPFAKSVFKSLLKKSSEYAWAIVERSSANYIGHIFVSAKEGHDSELGFLLFPENWGKGFATEAAREVVQFMFCDANIRRLIATTDIENRASIRVLEKVGFRFEEEQRDEFGPYYCYAIDREIFASLETEDKS